MITYSDKLELFNYFSYILFFGFKHDYSFDYVERHLSSASIVKTIEKKNECGFLYDSTLSDSIKEIYGLVQLFDDDIVAQSVYSLWISEAYLKLLFEYRKPLSFLFLYIPLEEMVRIFSPYHEMDWTHLYAEFERRVEQTSLLRAILDKENISINKLSQLTGISKNTLTTYLVDERLRAASFDNIYRISNVLELDIDIFADHINARNEYEAENKLIENTDLRSTLALYMVSYFSSDISNRKYIYDKDEEIYKYKDLKLKILFTSNNSDPKENDSLNLEADKLIEEYSRNIKKEDRKNYVIIINESNQISTSLSPYKKWLSYGYERIFILNPTNLICIKEDYWKSYISSSVINNIKDRVIS